MIEPRQTAAKPKGPKAVAVTRDLKRELIIDLETSALTPERSEIIRYRAVNRFDPDDQFDEWAKPSKLLSAEAECILGLTNQQLTHFRPNRIGLGDFCTFIDGGGRQI